MLIDFKTSRVNGLKVYELREGVANNGEPNRVIQTVVSGVCIYQEIFTNVSEGDNWFSKVCN